jgi:histidinol-phosphatase
MPPPPPPPADPDVLDFAVRLAARAGALAADRFFRGAAGTRKEDGTEVTTADLEVEEFVRAELARAAPDDAVFGEEGGTSPGRSGRRWTVDPISGTGYFSRRMPVFAHLLAYQDEHGPAIGVIAMPIQREIVYAGRGRGCWLRAGDDAVRTTVGDRADLAGALTLTGNQHTWSEPLLVALHRQVALVGAVHHAVVHVVTGRADLAVATCQREEDLAPLPVIVAEAGGTVTDLAGHPPTAGDGSVVAANPALHRQVLALTAGLPTTARPKALR